MRYLALACDYDGTIAHHGHVDEATIAALERLKASGRKLVLVTGRHLDDLMSVFPRLQLFDRVVAENGALLYDPSTGEEQLLGEAPPIEFAQELERRGVRPVSRGRVIVATWEPHDATVLQVIREMALELQVIFNKGAVMVLPSGLNKAVGLRHALEALRLSPHNAVGIGDAENDHAFLTACECSVAVSNALDSVKARVDYVTAAHHGAGVSELIDRILESDLAEVSARITRHDVMIGQTGAGTDVRLSPFDGGILIAGLSGAGKTTVTTGLLERLCDAHYQFCVIDPEGDYHAFPGAIASRGSDMKALAEDALRVLERPNENAVITLLDLRLEDRPRFLEQLLPSLHEFRNATSRPHWLVIDEAHHLVPSTLQQSDRLLPGALKNLILVTVHPEHVALPVLDLVETLVVVGGEAQKVADAFTRARGLEPISLPDQNHDRNSAWLVRLGTQPLRYRYVEPAADRRRHQRKYAEGELGEDNSFYFRGPEGRLNLRAQNLAIFMQLADGVDDETWQHHLRRHDVSHWFGRVIKDPSLAEEAAQVEAGEDLDPAESRNRIRNAIQRRYTSPA